MLSAIHSEKKNEMTDSNGTCGQPTPPPPPINDIAAWTSVGGGGLSNPQVRVRMSRRSNSQDDSVYVSLRPVVVVATCLGMMPMSRATERHSHRLTFSWWSPQTLTTLGLLGCLALSSTAAAYFYAVTPASSWNIEEMAIRPRESVFYASCATFLILSLRTTRRIPDLLTQWDATADRLRKYVAALRRSNVRCNLHLNAEASAMFAVIFMMSAATEHVLHDFTIWHKLCDDNQTMSPVSTFLECYYIRGNEYFEHVVAYSAPLAVTVLVFNKFATIAWNFQDLFIVVLSLALRSNFRVITRYLQLTWADKKTSDEWMIVREDHYGMTALVIRLDKIISPAILVSYAVNVYFLCIQIFYAIRPCIRTPIETAYFYSSFFHLLFRLCAVSFAAASFYDEAMKPLNYLHRCPSSCYCEEVNRFITHIYATPAAFTGCKFFIINRHLFLAIISVILTYELILLNVT